MKKLILVIFIVSFLVLFSQNAEATNSVKQIIKFTGTYTAGADFRDFTISPALTNIDKSMVWVMFRHIGDSQHDITFRSWEILDPTTLRIYGGSASPASNIASNIAVVIVEFTTASEMSVQMQNFTIASSLPDGLIFDKFTSAINTTNSMLLWSGHDHDGVDSSVGQEEFARIRIFNTTDIEYDLFDSPNSGPQNNHYQVVEWNNSTISTQRGQGSLASGELSDTITPSTAIDRTRTLLFVSYRINGVLDAKTTQYSIDATINPSNQIVITRYDSSCGAGEGSCIIDYDWELTEFPSGFMEVQHEQIVQANGVMDSTLTITTLTNLTEAMVIGTVHTPFGSATGSNDGGGGSAGAFDRNTWTLQLNDASTVRAIRNDDNREATVGIQVVEFDVGGQTFSKNVTDSTTITDTVSRATDKVLQSIANVSDTIQLNANPNVTSDMNVSDTITFATNKTLQSDLDISDTIVLATTKLLQSIANITDTIIVTLTTGLFDQTTITDTINFTINKTLQSDLDISDTTNLETTKLLESDMNITDTVTTELLPSPPVPGITGGGGGGGGGVPKPPLSNQLTGLSLSKSAHTLSTEIIVNPFFLGRTSEGVLVITWDQQEPIQIKSIEVPAKFANYIDFEKDRGFEFTGKPVEGQDFATGELKYNVALPSEALGISPTTNPLGDDVSFFDWWYLVLFNEYKIPVKVTAIHNNNEFTLDSEITVTHVKEVRWVIIALTIAGGAWLAVWGRKAFRTTQAPLKSGSFQKKLDSVRGSTIDRQKRGSFSKELQRQRDSDRNQIRKLKKKAGKSKNR